jgi:uncharacterized protein (DUF1501 family)
MTFRHDRRQFLQLLGVGGATAALASSPLTSALAATEKAEGEFFVFVHAAGGWDVTLWSDPRNEKKGIVDPATTDHVDAGPITHWKDAPAEGEVRSFQIVQPAGCKIPFGPGIGAMLDHFSELTLINGLSMNTVSHPDGTNYSATGRHLVGGRTPASSVDTMIANEMGGDQTFPVVSINYPSSYVGDGLDRRVVPLRIGNVGVITRALERASAWESEADREAVTAVLSHEARDLAKKAAYTDVLDGFALQYDVLGKMLGSKLQDAFSPKGLMAAHPEFDLKGRFSQGAAQSAAFAVEAMKRNVVRCVSFAMGGFDTHGNNYRQQPLVQQELFGVVARLVKTLAETPHPTKAGKKLADHTHILVVSDFCRTPQINLTGGRDHYPNNSALIVSPRFRPNMVFGKTDHDQLLPMPAGGPTTFEGGPRAISPPDVLCTFLSAFALPYRRYLRDGQVVKELLRA